MTDSRSALMWRGAGILILVFASVRVGWHTASLERTIAQLRLNLDEAVTQRDEVLTATAISKCNAMAVALDATIRRVGELEASVQRQYSHVERLTQRLRDAEDTGRPLPKFGKW